MASETTLRVYETRTLLNKAAFSGTDVEPMQVVSGSRMLITLLVTSIDVGATVNLFIDNSFSDSEAFDTIQTLSLNTSGRVKRILSDFHNLFRFRYTVTGGSASFKVGVSLFDNAMTTRIDNAIVEVDLHHNIDVQGNFDSVRIGDGTDLLEVNPDGSVNVVIGEAPDEEIINIFDEAAAVANGAETDILTYTVPAGKIAYLSRIDVSGENIARYEIYVDAELIARKRTWFGEGLNETFDFTTSSRRGLPIQPGEIITVKVLHARPFASNFEARLQALLKG